MEENCRHGKSMIHSVRVSHSKILIAIKHTSEIESCLKFSNENMEIILDLSVRSPNLAFRSDKQKELQSPQGK